MRRRLRSQLLAGNLADSGGDAITHMTCVQSQEHKTSVRACALRTTGRSSAGVTSALDDGRVVRSWPMRSTLQLVPAQDLGWMLSINRERTLKAWVRRSDELGITPTVLERAQRSALDALDGTQLTRDELNEVWSRAGVLGPPGRAYVLMLVLAVKGLVCYGPVKSGSPQVVRVDQWVKAPRALSGDEALDEWARRYFTSRGPATVADFAWWAGLKVTDARKALARVRDELATQEFGGVEHFMSPEVAAWDAGMPLGTLLLPAYDETVLGYKDRTASLPSAYNLRVIDHGHLSATVVHDGRVVGTWRRSRSGELEATAFTAFEPEVERSLPGLFAELPA